jgi:CBS domain-containing protein
VVDGAGSLRGVLTRDALINALKATGGATPVLEVVDKDVPTVPENACLDNIFQQLQRSGNRLVGVVDGRQRLVGYITAENLGELVLIQSSRAAGGPPGTARARPQPV